MSVTVIDEHSPHLDAVRSLWRVNSDTLGFFPDGAFADYAHQRQIIVAQDASGECVGYLLYRVSKGKATIAHLCITDNVRRQGHARALVEHVIGLTGHLRGISLLCRRDFPAYDMWPEFGFGALYEKRGRAADGSELTYFWLSHNQPDLFANETAAFNVVIDSNVFVDLADSRNVESQGLLADWLQESIRLCLTVEHFNEFNRSDDSLLRTKRRKQAAYYHRLESDPEAYRNAKQLLGPLFPNLVTPQDKSDFRHLARTLAVGAWAFVTRDEGMLQRSDAVYALCGLPVVPPAELIGRIDELLHEREYQHFRVAGTKGVFRQRANSTDDELIGAIKVHGETKRHLNDQIRSFLSDPQRFTCATIRDGNDNPLAFYVVERQPRFDAVRMLRTCAHRLAGTLARTILTDIIFKATRDRQAGVIFAEPNVTNDLHFRLRPTWVSSPFRRALKLVPSGVHPTAAVADWVEEIGSPDVSIAQLAGLLRSTLGPNAASEVEHVLWPVKLADAGLPSYIIPIRPEYAQHLFDESLAKQTLFGADIDLALNPESVYYRDARPKVIEAPGRILWYASKDDGFEGSIRIRACSRIAEVCIDKPKVLFKRFQRLGVYKWSDVVQTAKGDYDREIMAVRFHDTEPIGAIKWDAFQTILKKHAVFTQLQSPCRIPQHVFNEIYTLALSSSSFR